MNQRVNWKPLFWGQIVLILLFGFSASSALALGDGKGEMRVAPTTVVSGSVVELVFTYTPEMTINDGEIRLTVPDNWPSPCGGFMEGETDGCALTEIEADAGAVLGIPTFSGKSVSVPLTALAVGQRVRIKYGGGGGNNGVVVPSELGVSIFNVQIRRGGTVTPLESPSITTTLPASRLNISAPDSLLAGDSLQITVQTLDVNGNPATSVNGVTVNFSFSPEADVLCPNLTFPFGDGSVTAVTIPTGQTSVTLACKGTTTTGGITTITATAAGFTTATHTVKIIPIPIRITVIGSPVKAGDTVVVTATGKPGEKGILLVDNTVFRETLFPRGYPIEMTESPAGVYTGVFTPVSGVHPDGVYDAVVQIGQSSLTGPDVIVIDNTPPRLNAPKADRRTTRNGQTLILCVKSESGLSVSADVSALDLTQKTPIPLVESETEAGTYCAPIVISRDNPAGNGLKPITIHAADAAGNVAQPATVIVELQNGFEFQLSIPEGIGLIYIPLKVTAVDSKEMVLKTVGDFFDVLGKDVNFLISYDAEARMWRTYLGSHSRGKAADLSLTDETCLITVMKRPVMLCLKGEALGTLGVSQIHLTRGANLVGVPLRDERLNKASDLLALFKGKVTAIIVSDNGEFKVVARAGDAGDIPITGDRCFILIARQACTAEIRGAVWNVPCNIANAPPIPN
jgi:ribosomal protein L23